MGGPWAAVWFFFLTCRTVIVRLLSASEVPCQLDSWCLRATINVARLEPFWDLEHSLVPRERAWELHCLGWNGPLSLTI